MTQLIRRVAKAEQWAAQVCTQYGKTVEAIIDTGRILIKAKADLVHGEWGRIFDEKLVPFSREYALRFMAIADNAVLANRNNCSDLPSSVSTLYALTRLPEPTLKHALADGLITAKTTGKDIKALLPPKAARVTDPKSFRDGDAERIIALLVTTIREVVMAWPKEAPIEDLVLALEHEAQRVRARMEKPA